MRKPEEIKIKSEFRPGTGAIFQGGKKGESDVIGQDGEIRKLAGQGFAPGTANHIKLVRAVAYHALTIKPYSNQ